jgi:hypothetical protein
MKREGSKVGNKEIVINSHRHTAVYSKQIMEYANASLTEPEQCVYKEITDAILKTNDLDKPQDLLLLDIATFDYIRIKRLHEKLMKGSEIDTTVMPNGNKYDKVKEASYLLNAVQTSFRNSLKELGISGKERLKQKLGLGVQDFASFMSEPIEATLIEDKSDNNESSG